MLLRARVQAYTVENKRLREEAREGPVAHPAALAHLQAQVNSLRTELSGAKATLTAFAHTLADTAATFTKRAKNVAEHHAMLAGNCCLSLPGNVCSFCVANVCTQPQHLLPQNRRKS